MFKLKFLPATIGDAIWISYGTPEDPHYLLVDGGTAGTRKHIERELKALDEDKRRLELVVVSHIDKDHIQGIRRLVEKRNVAFEIGDFWYNGFKHLPEPPEEAAPVADLPDVTADEANATLADEALGAKQAEALSEALVEQQIRWNQAFAGNAVKIGDAGPLPAFTLAGGMKVTVLGPFDDGLVRLRRDWIRELEEAGMTPGEPEPQEPPDSNDEALGVADFLTADDVSDLAATPCPGDSSAANASSISLLLEFEGKRALLAADAHVAPLLAALERVSPNAPLTVDLFKLSHHGSKGTTNREVLEKVATHHYVFSTNGSIFKHPDDETVAKVLTFGGKRPQLTFNYRKPTNVVWEEASLQRDLEYATLYPEEGEEGIEVVLG